MGKKSTTKKKTSNKHLQKPKKNIFDFSTFKDRIKKEMTMSLIPTNSANINPNDYIKKSYEREYVKYITETFKSSTIVILNRICTESKTLPKDLTNNYPIHSLLIKITKELMLNDLELIYLSVYFDNFGWVNNSLDIMDNLIVTALSVKKYLNSDIDILENYLALSYPDIMNKFNIWIKNQKEFKENIIITPREINERYKLLNKPANNFCKANFIDYNESVDKILRMSALYNEQKEEEKKDKKKEKIKKKEKYEGEKKINSNINCDEGSYEERNDILIEQRQNDKVFKVNRVEKNNNKSGNTLFLTRNDKDKDNDNDSGIK